MKKLIKTLPPMAAMMAAMMALTGCIVDSSAVRPHSGEDDVDVLLRLRTPGQFSERTTRALDAGGENAILDIHVLVFDQAGNLSSVEIGTQVSGGALENPTDGFSGEGRFEVTLPASKNGEQSRLVVLANLDSVPGVTGNEGTLSGLEGKSYHEVVEALSVAITGPLYTGAAPAKGFSIPMWGQTELVTIDLDLTIQSLDLTRALARIDVGVGRPLETGTEWDGKRASGDDIPFTLTSVYVMRPGNRYAILPERDKHQAGLPTIIGGTDPDVVSFSATESALKFGYTTTNGFTTREIYIPEANIRQDGEPGDANHDRRMALVVGGTYQEQTHYYRVDFIDGESGELIDVLRNHLYQFNIADVVGPGYSSPELAYANPSMNIEVKIVGWTPQVFEDVKIVRDRYFSLSRRSPFELPPLDGQSEVLTIETNIESFTMTLASPPRTLSSGTGGTVSSSNFKYTLAGSGGAYTLTIETLNDNLGGSPGTPSDTWTVDAGGIIGFDYTARQAWSEFDPTPHAITLAAGTGGTIATTHATAPQGTSVTLWANPQEGYVFTGWSLSSGPDDFTLPATTSPEMTFIMPGGEVTIAAAFTTGTLTATANDSASWKPAEQYTTGEETPAGEATGPKTITVTANVPWKATLSDTANFALSGTTSATANGSFKVFPKTSNDAPTAAPRQVTVIVAGGGITRNIVLTQASISDKDFDFDGNPDDWTDKDLEQNL